MNARKTHESLVLASDILAIVASGVILWKLVNSNDSAKIVRMQICRTTARIAKREAAFWSHLATSADTKYWQIANVTS
jgi:hypothetical protein